MAEGNKSEKPTDRRKQKAREKGQVARSRDLATAATLLAVTFMLAWQPQVWVGRWRGLFERLLAEGAAGDLGLGTPILTWTGVTFAQWIAPVIFLAFAVAVFSTAAQSGFVFAAEAFKPNWGRLNPVANVSQLFSLSGLSRVLRSLIPAAAIILLAVNLFEKHLPQILHASRFGSRALLGELGVLLFELAWKYGLVFLIWSGADYFFQRWNHQRSLMMTKEEVKEETKDLNGNPVVRGRIRRLRRAMFKQMMAKDIARATAVVTNPTHYAVALEYRPETMAAPVVVAKGRNLLAQKIKQIARWHDIPIVENPPLAQALFKAADVGQAIPPNLYKAVAEILAFIYRVQQRMQTSATGAR